MRAPTPLRASRLRRHVFPSSSTARPGRAPRHHRPVRLNASANGDDPQQQQEQQRETSAGLKAAWYSAEAVGNLVGAAKAAAGEAAPTTAVPAADSGATRMAFADAVKAIREDYDALYFVSGKGDLAAYDPACFFADDFASFTGTERFVRNVANLGSTLSDVRLKLTSFEEDEAAGEVRTTWTFSGVVDALPWKPRLAAAGSTTHALDRATGRVVRHIEAWSSSPGEVVAALVKPAAPIPGNRWERAAAAAAAGDAGGCAAAGLKAAALAAFHAAGVAAVARLVSGGGMTGGEAFLWGGGVVQAALDALLPVLGTPGGGGPARRKDRR